MQDFLKRMLVSFIFLGMLVSISVAVRCSVPQYRKWRECTALRRELQADVDGAKAQISETKRKIDRFHSSRWFVEQLARENHRVAENEIVFVFE